MTIGVHDDPSTRFGTATIAEVQRRLYESTYAGLRNLRCDFDDGVLTLRGTVPSFFLMQIAQTIAAGVEDVQQVANHISVKPGR